MSSREVVGLIVAGLMVLIVAFALVYLSPLMKAVTALIAILIGVGVRSWIKED